MRSRDFFTSSPSLPPTPAGRCGSFPPRWSGRHSRWRWPHGQAGWRCCTAPPPCAEGRRGGCRAWAAPRPRQSGCAGIPRGAGRWRHTAAGAVLKPSGGNCAVLPLHLGTSHLFCAQTFSATCSSVHISRKAPTPCRSFVTQGRSQ